MPRRSKTLLDRAGRVSRVSPPVVMMIGCPEATKLFPTKMNSEREAVIGTEYFEALDGETTSGFHARTRQIARDRGVRMVMLGCEGLKARYDYDDEPTGPRSLN
jgi:hypothetical protein